MFVLRGLKGVIKYEKFHRSKYLNVRFQGTENLVKSKEYELEGKRRYVKPVVTKELKLLRDNFLRSLFGGTIDKEIFEYPAVLRTSDIHLVLNHSTEVEDFLKDNSEVKLSQETIEKLRKLELFGLSIPQKYGGAGYSETECTFLHECTGSNLAIGRFLGYNENFGSKILNLYGTESQKEKYLPRLAQGKSFISLAYIENGPIIDLSKIEGFAINDEVKNHFVLKAEKKWVHDADKADLFLVLAKAATFSDEDPDIQLKLNFFIVERNTPGLTIHKLKSEFGQENNLYEVSLNEVVVQEENILGGLESDGFQILKTALAYNNVTEAALCCNLLKKIMHQVMWFIHEKNLVNTSVTGQSLCQDNLAFLVLYTYALESVVYLLTGRYDTYSKPDLFYESIFAKALAVDFLQMAISRYIDVLGRKSFQSSGILEEAIKTVQYYSVFEENINYLKMLGAAEGFIQCGHKLRDRIKMLRTSIKPDWRNFVYSEEKLLQNLKDRHKFRLELQQSLQYAGDSLEESYVIFQDSVEKVFVKIGPSVTESEHTMTKFGEMAAYLYATIACLSRASSSLCYDFNDCQNEAILAEAITHFTQTKIKQFYKDEIDSYNLFLLYKNLGKETFNRKEYPVEHPLSRTF